MNKLIYQSAIALCLTLLFTQCKKNNEDLPSSPSTKSGNETSVTTNSKANKQTNCPDLEVTEIRVDTIASGNPALVRFRFFVVVQNTGDVVYDPAATYGQHYINLSFIAPGYPGRHMAQQNMFTPINVNDFQQMLFEVNADRIAKTLPDWENMPVPTDYCGFVTTGTVPANYECTLSNNELCEKDKFIKRILR